MTLGEGRRSASARQDSLELSLAPPKQESQRWCDGPRSDHFSESSERGFPFDGLHDSGSIFGDGFELVGMLPCTKWALPLGVDKPVWRMDFGENALPRDSERKAQRMQVQREPDSIGGRRQGIRKANSHAGRRDALQDRWILMQFPNVLDGSIHLECRYQLSHGLGNGRRGDWFHKGMQLADWLPLAARVRARRRP